MIGLGDEQSRAFLDAAPDAMVIVDAGGRIAFVNAQSRAVFGYSRDELVGRPIEILLPARFRGRHVLHRKGFDAAPRTRRMGEGLELYALRKDGTEFPAEVSLSPVETRDGVFVSSSIRDISDRKAIERQLIESRERAERADRAKSAFLAAASHDLRQPLQTLTLLSSVLSRAVPKGSNAAAAVASQAEALKSMSKLLNSLLDISKLEAGVVEPDITDCSVQRIFEVSRAEFAALAEAKGLELIVEDCDDVVRTDPTLLGQIIQNLLANAIRYTRTGWVRLRGFAAAAGTVRIEVLDTGIGIPASELTLIFDEFYQAQRFAGQAREGLGLGLSIVRRTANLLGHPLEVRSRVGEGSCFALSVPKSSVSLAGKEAQGGRPAAGTAAGLVLVVDDDEAVAGATALLLRTTGLDVVLAGSAEEARARLLERGRTPGLVICDYHLGSEQTGLDAISSVREAARFRVPAILVSGDTSSALADGLGDVEDCHLLRKPVDADELLSLATRLLQDPPH